MSVNKREITNQIDLLLLQLAEADDTPPEPIPRTSDAPIEMLTVKECVEAVRGLSEHTVRQLVAQKKIPYIRAGEGKRGKILIPKPALLEYLGTNL